MNSGSTAPLFHPSNILDSPASSMAGASAVLGVVASALTNGWPVNPAGWLTLVISVVTGVGALFTRA